MKYWRDIFMFVDNDSWDVEEICYDHTHIQNVVSEIKKNFDTILKNIFRQRQETEYHRKTLRK